MKLGTHVGLGLGPGHIVLDGNPTDLKKGDRAPNFLPMSIVDKRLGGSRCHLVCTGTREIVLGPRPPKKGQPALQFSAHDYCGQTAGWMNMHLGRTVLDGDTAAP